MKCRLIPIVGESMRAWVYPEQGFQLFGLEYKRGKSWIPVIFAPDMDREPADRRYGNPILFPAPSASHAGEILNAWSHDGEVHPMAFHGFARNSYWHLLKHSESSVSAELSPQTETKLSFPFEFILRLTYTISKNSLVLDAIVQNLDDKPFPYGFGLHPYLQCPLGGEGTKADCSIKLPSGKRIVSKNFWRTSSSIPFPAQEISAIDHDHLTHTIVLSDSGASELELKNQKNGMITRVSVKGSKNSFPIWAIWSDTPEDPYVCIEPWTDYPNMLGRKETVTCPPAASKEYQMTISVQES
jgi:galactose mutarotase-like enzyme